MKKKLVLTLAAILAAIFLFSCAPQTTVTLRVEGNESTVIYGNVVIEEGMNLQDLMIAFDEVNEKITFAGAEEDYIYEVNGEAAGKFGGYDGWCVMVNGKNAETSMSGITLSPGDDVVLYYGDPFGVGMIFPEVKVEGNSIVFTDENGAPIEGITVELDGKEYKTNAEGRVEDLAAGEYTMNFSLFSESGVTRILRRPKDTRVTIK